MQGWPRFLRLNYSSTMASPFTYSIILPLFLVFHLSFNSAKAESSPHLQCSDVQCKEEGKTRFFYHNMGGIPCGVFDYNCRKGLPQIQFQDGGSWYVLKNFSEKEKMLFIQEAELVDYPDLCTAVDKFADEPNFLPKYLEIAGQEVTFFKCGHDDKIPKDCPQHSLEFRDCGSHVLYYFPKNISQLRPPISCGMDKCAPIQIKGRE